MSLMEEPPSAPQVQVSIGEAHVHLSEASAGFLLLMLDQVSFKGSEAKMKASVAQMELERELRRLHPEPEKPVRLPRAERRRARTDGQEQAHSRHP